MAHIPPSKTVVSLPTNILNKRQARPTESVVHVTITAAGTVVYTQTATSYSYIASYSTISPSNSISPNGSGQPGSTDQNLSTTAHTNIGAIVGGVVGGVAGIALIGLAFFLYRRAQNRKRRHQSNFSSDPNNTTDYYQDMNQPQNPGMTSLSPTPRHFIAPLEQIEKHELAGGVDTKYFYNGNGYYDDIIPPYPKAYYSVDNSVASDSLPSTTVDTSVPSGSIGFRHVPDEVDCPATVERHVPNAKEDGIIIVEPPHTKD